MDSETIIRGHITAKKEKSGYPRLEPLPFEEIQDSTIYFLITA